MGDVARPVRLQSVLCLFADLKILFFYIFAKWLGKHQADVEL